MALPAQRTARDESLEKLQRGEMSLDEYLDEQVEAALAMVKGRISGERLDLVREVIRESLRTDPVMVELVHRATGQVSVANSGEVKH